MKNKKLELNVDFIGGQVPLTKEEKEAISKYIREYKAKHLDKKKTVRTSRTREKVTA
jgi:hypothetical protein